jgi:phosphoesterase RecJ-like protein
MEAMDGLTNFLNALDHADIIMVLTEMNNGEIKGSLRTTKDHINVNTLAQKLGGGGHPKASGFTIKGSFQKTPMGWQIV